MRTFCDCGIVHKYPDLLYLLTYFDSKANVSAVKKTSYLTRLTAEAASSGRQLIVLSAVLQHRDKLSLHSGSRTTIRGAILPATQQPQSVHAKPQLFVTNLDKTPTTFLQRVSPYPQHAHQATHQLQAVYECASLSAWTDSILLDRTHHAVCSCTYSSWTQVGGVRDSSSTRRVFIIWRCPGICRRSSPCVEQSPALSLRATVSADCFTRNLKTILYNAAFIPQHFSHCFLTFKLLGALAVPLGHLRRPNLDFYRLTD